MFHRGVPVMSTERHSTRDGVSHYWLQEWVDLIHRQERIRFPLIDARQSIRSCKRDHARQEGVEGSAQAIHIRTTTRSPAKLFRRPVVERTLLSRDVCIQVIDPPEVNEPRWSSRTSKLRDDVGRFDETMHQLRMLSMQV